MSASKLDYYLINATKCGPEELFVLIGGFSEEYGLEKLINALVSLVNNGFLSCKHGAQKESTSITQDEIDDYIKLRLESGEKLDEYPGVTEEYRFTATEKGIETLSEEDKPIDVQ